MRLKADTAAEAELWVAKLKSAHIAAVKRAKDLEMEKVQGYLAHKKQPPPPRANIGP